MRNHLTKAIAFSDDWVVEFQYRDSKGNCTVRTVSPIRFQAGDRFLGLCLSREEPRQFYLSRCSEMTLKPANEVLMPVPIRELVAA